MYVFSFGELAIGILGKNGMIFWQNHLSLKQYSQGVLAIIEGERSKTLTKIYMLVIKLVKY